MELEPGGGDRSPDIDYSGSGREGEPLGDDEIVSLDGVPSPATLVDRVGAKAANLIQALRAGLPVLPGVVLTSSAAKALAEEHHPDHDRVSRRWLARTNNLACEFGGRLVVRSSSPLEDGARESRAGFSTSVVDVIGDDAVAAATIEVIGSAGGDAMAVLVQPLVDPIVSGVLFGIDPVTGDDRLLLIAAAGGSPEQLISGSSATQYHLSHRGRIIGVDHPSDGESVILNRKTVRALARLAHAATQQFKAPQDVEWAVDGQETLWVLQSRTVLAQGPKA